MKEERKKTEHGTVNLSCPALPPLSQTPSPSCSHIQAMIGPGASNRLPPPPPPSLSLRLSLSLTPSSPPLPSPSCSVVNESSQTRAVERLSLACCTAITRSSPSFLSSCLPSFLPELLGASDQRGKDGERRHSVHLQASAARRLLLSHLWHPR